MTLAITLFFYFLFILYLGLAGYLLILNPKKHINKLFMWLCLSLSVWTLALSLSNSASTYEIALEWRKWASLGWGTVFSIFLNIVIVLTDSKWTHRHPIVKLSIYLPSVILIYFYRINNAVANNQFNLVKKSSGWINVPTSGLIDAFFNSYYIGYSLAAFILLLIWYKKVSVPSEKFQAKYLAASFGGSVLVGTFTDTVFNRMFEISLPSLAPLIILFPILTITFIIRKYQFLAKDTEDTDENLSAQILDNTTHNDYFIYISMIFFIGSCLNILHYVFYETTITRVLMLSSLMIVLSFILYFCTKLNITKRTKENILILIITITIPLVNIVFLFEYGSNIVWPVTLIFIMASIVFNNKLMLKVFTAVGMTTSFISWRLLPKLAIEINSLDYFSRIVIFIMGFLIANHIKKVYISRIKAVKSQMNHQVLIAEMMKELALVNSNNIDAFMNTTLKNLVSRCESQRSCIATYLRESNELTFDYVWSEKGGSDTYKHMAIKINEKLFLGRFTGNEEAAMFYSGTELLQLCHGENYVSLIEDIGSVSILPFYEDSERIRLIAVEYGSENNIVWKNINKTMIVISSILRDAFKKIKIQEDMMYLASYDQLTGLPNRTKFQEILEDRIKQTDDPNEMMSVMLIDIDDFKSVNDAMGHDWGDKLLEQIALRITGDSTRNATISRFSGDEFLILEPQISHNEEIGNRATKIMEAFSRAFNINSQEFFVTISMGISLYPKNGDTASSLIKCADLAVNKAKSNGKNQIQLCSQDDNDVILQTMLLTNSLYRALENNELYLVYQPKVCTYSKDIVGFEALLRWEHPTLGNISPARFIPIAEQTGLIKPIGEWVIEKACTQAVKWQESGLCAMPIAVNLSIEQFRNSDLVEIVKRKLNESSLEPRYLELEITEGTLLYNTEQIVNELNELRKLGVSISIDDFGTEYSSLSRLKILPISSLKIDIGFVRGIGKNMKDEAIILVMIQLAKSLGVKIIAEGVEEKEQADFLEDNGCDEIQGFYYYKPLTTDYIEAELFHRSAKFADRSGAL